MIFTDRVNGLPIFEADGLPDTVKPFEKVWLFTTADLFDTGERETTGFLYGESRRGGAVADRMVIVLDCPLPPEGPEIMEGLVRQIRETMSPQEFRDDSLIRVAIRDAADRVIAVFEEDEMGLVKHGEGSVLPDSDEQAKKQASAQGLSKDDVDAIVAEGRDDDCDADEG